MKLLRVLCAALSAVFLLTACGTEDDPLAEPFDEAENPAEEEPQNAAAGGEDIDVPMPEWLVEVYPEPGAALTGVRQVQARYTVLPADQGVRLLIDDVDVTTYSDEGQGQVVYDPNAGPGAAGTPTPPVALDPGDHEAEVLLVELAEVGEEPRHAVLDRFSWTFTIM